jgi:hypothetical protein
MTRTSKGHTAFGLESNLTRILTLLFKVTNKREFELIASCSITLGQRPVASDAGR